MSDYWREVAWAVAGDRGCIGRASAQSADNPDSTERGDAEPKAHGHFDVLSHCVADLHGFRGDELSTTSTVPSSTRTVTLRRPRGPAPCCPSVPGAGQVVRRVRGDKRSRPDDQRGTAEPGDSRGTAPAPNVRRVSVLVLAATLEHGLAVRSSLCNAAAVPGD